MNRTFDTSSIGPLVYVLPVHNEALVLEANIERLVAYLAKFPGSCVFAVENGSSDDSWKLAQRLAESASTPEVVVRAFREEKAGLGYAYHRGLSEALDAFGSTRGWSILTAADLPFGFSDLEAALVHLTRPGARILMGSKAHPSSLADTGAKRRAMSMGYRVARKAILGMRVGDSQGSVFVRLDLAAELVPRIVSRDFFYSTELCHYAERAGETIEELPVVLEASARTSTVKPLKHGYDMARQLIALRQRRSHGR